MLALDKVTRADFAQCLEQEFELITGTGGITLTLIAVDQAAAGTGTRAQPFSLTFRGASGLLLPQGTYRLQNQTLGPMEIPLAQIAPRGDGSLFEAVINRAAS